MKPPIAKLTAVTIVLALLVTAIFGASQIFGIKADSGTKRTVELLKLWSFTAGMQSVTSPVVADGLVYATSGTIGGSRVSVYCLNSSSGSLIWNHTGFFDLFTVADGYVYVGESAVTGSVFTFYGAALCLNAFTGAQLWNYSAGTGFAAPVVGGGTVYFGGFNYTRSIGTNLGFIYAFNAYTGKKIWSFLGPPGTRFDHDALVLTNGKLYALSAVYSEKDASWVSGIYAFNAGTGEELWNYTTPGQFNSLAVANHTVYVSSNFVDTTGYLDAKYSGGHVYKGGILALNAISGVMKWDYPINGSVEPPILSNGKVYSVSDNEIYALNASDGTAIWKLAFDKNMGHAKFVNGSLYVGSSDGVYCFKSNSALIWNFTFDNYTASSATCPTYADGIIYIGWNGAQSFSPITENNFYALDALSGEKIGNYTIGYAIKSAPNVVNGVVYVGASSISTRNIDYAGPGAVIAFNSTIAQLPSQTPSPLPLFPDSTTTLIAGTAIVVVVILAVGFLVRMKRAK